MGRIMEKELQELKDKLLRLGALVESQVERSVTSLVERDNMLAASVIDTDHEVNRLEVEIDEDCILLLALRHPEASDLRFVTTAMKIVTDLERMGDLAVDISERALEINEEPLLKPYIDIPRMARAARQMLKDALDAFVNKDAALARKVTESDDYVDNLNHQIFRELLLFMLEDPHTISRAIRISYVSKYLERIADHATNIAEMVVYLVEGKIIRHMDKA
ncbi:MAG: phosphate signaling complex protein PhoU [Nitrospirae bacterium]|nr:phosphate signaling complex protein PhoU [Nitrospirota bacterium]MBI5694635.1 phosphate signaling complex protein PhoU [Nitrospirota bacterium]